MLYAFCCGIAFYRRLSVSFKILTWLLGITFLVEGGAFLLAYSTGNNLPLYNVFLLVQFFSLSLYFNYSIDTFRRHNTGVWIGLIGVSLGVINNICLQPLREVNSYFILLAGIAVISMSLYSFARSMLVREEEASAPNLLQYPQFWVAVSLTFFWSTSFLLWGLYAYFSHFSKDALPWVHVGIRLVNVITYSAIGTAILRYHIHSGRQDAVR